MGTDDRDSTQRQMDLSGDGGEASGSSGDDRGVGSIGNGDGGGAKKTLYLIDTSGFVFRAYHALPPFTNAQGLPTGAAYGFTNMLLGLLGEERPDYVAAVFDSGRAASFRREMYGEYKANRPKTPDDLVAQFPLVEKILDGFRVPHFVLESFEADDLIATLAEAARRAGFAVTVVSSDKDLMQLVGDDVRLLDTMKHRVYDRAAVREKFGVDPDKLGDWLALVGDSSDNVPGVPGVGAKTATKLLDAHGDLEAILAAAETIKGKKLSANLQEFADQARLSRRLVELQREAPFAFDLEALRRQDPDKDALWRLFEELGFGRLKSKLKLSAGPVDAGGGAEGMTVEGSADASAAGESFSPKPFDMIMDAAALAEVVEVIRGAGRFALALETTGTHPISAAIVGLGLSWGGSRDAYVPVGHRYLGAPAQLAEAAALRALMPLLSSPDVAVTVEESKFASAILARAEVALGSGSGTSGIVDVLIDAYVLDPQRDTLSLASLAEEYLAYAMTDRKKALGRQSIEEAPVETLAPVAAERARVLFALGSRLAAAIAEAQDLQTLVEDIELPLARVLAAMERRGCLVDVDALRALSTDLGSELARIEAKVQEEAGWPININSPKQLQKLLFEELGLTPGRKTKTGFSTDADVLADLVMEHPIAEEIEDYRGLSKLKSTYLDALPALVNRKTGRIHTLYNQTVTATGRLSSSEPNMQNIPIRTELGRQIRGAFIAPPGRIILSADYSQVELRVLAHLSGDSVLIDAFEHDEDVHRRTASEVFGVSPEEVDAGQRRIAKAVNFGVVYGQTDWGLARQLRISKAEASRYIEGYFARHAGVRAFMDETIAQAKRDGEVRTILGRRRAIPEINARRHNTRSYAERIARNTPIQGSAADLLKVAMIRVVSALEAAKLDAPMILTVHDELVFEVLPDAAERVAEVVREVMSQVHPLRVPLKVDIAWGRTWADAH